MIPLGLTVVAEATTDAAIQSKIFGSGMSVLIILNEEMDDIMKIVKFLKDLGLRIKGIGETIKSDAKEQEGRFLGMLLGELAASLLRNILASKLKISGGGVIITGFEIQSIIKTNINLMVFIQEIIYLK